LRRGALSAEFLLAMSASASLSAVAALRSEQAKHGVPVTLTIGAASGRKIGRYLLGHYWDFAKVPPARWGDYVTQKPRISVRSHVLYLPRAAPAHIVSHPWDDEAVQRSAV